MKALSIVLTGTIGAPKFDDKWQGVIYKALKFIIFFNEKRKAGIWLVVSAIFESIGKFSLLDKYSGRIPDCEKKLTTSGKVAPSLFFTGVRVSKDEKIEAYLAGHVCKEDLQMKIIEWRYLKFSIFW